MLQALIFDMDGTLFQTDKILELSLDDTFDARSLQLWDTVTPIDKYRELWVCRYRKFGKLYYRANSIEIREQTDAYFLDRLIENIKAEKALYIQM